MTPPGFPSLTRSSWLGIVGVFLLFVALRWNNFNAPLIRDEGEYAYAAQLLVQGVAPYEHAFIQKPPMVIYSYALADLLLPRAFWAPRLLAGLCVALATLLLGYIARLEFGIGFAWSAMWLVTPMILLPEVEQFTANTEMFLLLPLLATVAAYVHSRRHGQKPVYWLAAGFLGATTLCYKYTALPVLAFVCFVWSLELGRGEKNWHALGRCWLAAFAGALLAAFLELGFFLFHDGGAHLWECTVQFNRYYAVSSSFNLTSLWARLATFWSAWWILFFLPFAGLLKPHPRLWFWFGVFLCSILATSASAYGQYYIIMMPFWALSSAVGVRVLASFIAKWSALAAQWAGCLMTVLVVVLLLRTDVPWMKCPPERFADAKLSGYPFLESPAVAAKVVRHSSPDDFVFIAGSEPQILHYARRFSPTRFITMYSLMIPTPVVRHYQLEAIRDLSDHPPALIVLVRAGSSWMRQQDSPVDFFAFLDDTLRQNYDLIGGYVKDSGKDRWAEPLTAGDNAQASQLLYRRKRSPVESGAGPAR